MVRKKNTMLILLKMQLRNIKKHIGQFLSIIMIGAIAVTLFVGLYSNSMVFDDQIQTVFDQGNVADLYVTCDDFKQEDEDFIKSLTEENGDQFEERLYLPATINNKNIYLGVVDSMPSISKPYGDLYTDNTFTDDNFVLLDYQMIAKEERTNFSFFLGDDVTFSISTSLLGLDETFKSLEDVLKDAKVDYEMPSEISLDMKVNGFMKHPENVTRSNYNTSLMLITKSALVDSLQNYLDSSLQGARDTIKEYIENIKKDHPEIDFSKIDVDEIIDYLMDNLDLHSLMDQIPKFVNQYLIKCKDPTLEKDYKNKINKYFQQKEENNLFLLATKEEMPFFLIVTNDAKQAKQFIYIFPAVFFLVAILVILTTLSQMVIKDRSTIGALKAIGLKKKEIYANYMTLSSLLVSIGWLLGVIIGPLLVPNILGNKYTLLYTLPGMRYIFPIIPAILTFVFMIGLTCLVTYGITRKEVSLRPVESMRPKQPTIKSRVRGGEKEKKVRGLSISMALRNIRLSKGKASMVIAGILGCTALLLAGFGIEDTVDYGLVNDMGIFLKSDITVDMASSMSEEKFKEYLYSSDIENRNDGLTNVEDSIAKMEFYNKQACTFYSDDGLQTTKMIYLLSEDSIDTTVGLKLKDRGIALPKKVAENIKVDVGDEVKIQVNSKSYYYEVTSIFDAFYYNSAVLPYEEASKINLSSHYNGAWLFTKEGVKALDLSNRIKGLEHVSSSMTYTDYEGLVNGVMSSITTMTNAVKIFAILLAIVVIFNLALMNYQQKTRDIATLKVLGFTKREIALSLLFEVGILTFMGMAIGMLLGYPFMYSILLTNKVELVNYIYHIAFKSYIIAFVLTFIVSMAINAYFAFKTKKIQMVESLKSVE